MHNHDYCILTFGRDSLRLLYFNFPVFWHFGFIAPAATMSQHINSGLFVLSNMAEKALAKFTFRKRRRNTHHWYLEYIEKKNCGLTEVCAMSYFTVSMRQSKLMSQTDRSETNKKRAMLTGFRMNFFELR